MGAVYWSYDLGYDKATAKAQLKTQAMLSEIEQDWRKKYQDGVRKAEELQAKLDNIQIQTRVIKEKVKVYVTPEKDEFCDPSVGVVRLLNDAKDSKLSEAPADVDATGNTASGVGYSGFVLDQIDTIEAYNKLMEQHNQLVKWIDDNYE